MFAQVRWEWEDEWERVAIYTPSPSFTEQESGDSQEIDIDHEIQYDPTHAWEPIQHAHPLTAVFVYACLPFSEALALTAVSNKMSQAVAFYKQLLFPQVAIAPILQPWILLPIQEGATTSQDSIDSESE